MLTLTVEDLPRTTAKTVEKLKREGIWRLEELAMLQPRRLAEVTGVSTRTAERLLEKTRNLLNEEAESSLEVYTAKNLREQREEHGWELPTGSDELNDLLDGGYHSRSLTELAGEFGSGKSQACFTALVNLFRLVKNGGRRNDSYDETGVVFIDAEHTFNDERVTEIAKEKGLDPNGVLENVLVSRPQTVWQQRKITQRLPKYIREENAELVIVDSMTSLYRRDYKGRGELAARQQHMLQTITHLKKVTDAYNLVALVTNQVTANPDKRFGGLEPIGGNIMAHNMNERLLLKRRGDTVEAELIDSSWLPPGEAEFKISTEGIK